MKGPAVVHQHDGRKHAVLGKPYVVLPNGHNLILGHPDASGAFDVGQWGVSHHLTGHLGYRGVSILSVSLY